MRLCGKGGLNKFGFLCITPKIEIIVSDAILCISRKWIPCYIAYVFFYIAGMSKFFHMDNEISAISQIKDQNKSGDMLLSLLIDY